MPIPRRFDRRPPERDQTRVNERIRVPEVRLIGEDGNQVGVLSRDDALKYAQQRDLDLVEVAAEARPPVVRVLDYSKYKYEQEQKAKAARRHQKNVNVREIKLRPKIAENDYSTKKGHVERFLRGQDKVKVTIMFRGRETTHPERGERLLMRLAGEVGEIGTVEQRPTQDGRNMTMMLAPIKPRPEAESEAEAPAGTAAPPAPSAPDGPAAADGPTAAPADGPAPGDGPAAAAEPADAAAAAEPTPAAAERPAEPASADGPAAADPAPDDEPGPAAPAADGPARPAEPAPADGAGAPAPRRGGTRAKAR